MRALFLALCLLVISCGYQQDVVSPSDATSDFGSKVTLSVSAGSSSLSAQLQQGCSQLAGTDSVLQLSHGVLVHQSAEQVVIATTSPKCTFKGAELFLDIGGNDESPLTQVTETQLVRLSRLNIGHADALGLSLAELQEQVWQRQDAARTLGLVTPAQEPVVQLLYLQLLDSEADVSGLIK